MLIRRFPLILAMTWSVGIAGCAMCNDDRPELDEKVGTWGKNIGEAKQDLEQADQLPEVHASVDDLVKARQRFDTSSQVQVALFASEIEGRAADKNVPVDRVETLRRDYWNLVKLRKQVLSSPDATFNEALSQYDSQVDTIREQLARLDRSQLP
jgi:hypothetical protein